MKFRLCVVTMLIAGALPLVAQEAGPLYYCKQITTTEGLSQPHVNTVTADNNGALWVGTKYGLNKITNGAVKTYSENQLSGGNVKMIFEDSSGRLWVSTEKGLSSYDKPGDSFVCCSDRAAFKSCEHNGKVYFGCSREVLVFDVIDGHFSHTIPFECGEMIGMFPLSGDNVLIVSKTNGIFNLNPENGIVSQVEFSSFPISLITSAGIYDSKVWLGIFLNGLYYYDPKYGDIRKFSGDRSSVSPQIILSMEECDGKLFLGTDGEGLCVLERSNISRITETDEFKGLHLPNTITSLYADSYNNLWVGSYRDGLFGLKPTYIHSYSLPESPRGLDYSTISCLADDSRQLWVGTDGGGVSSLTKGDSALRYYPETGNGQIVSLCDFDERHILYSSYCKGLYKLDKISGAAERFLIVNEDVDRRECFSGSAPFLSRISDDTILILAEQPYIYHISDAEFIQCTCDDPYMESGTHVFYVNSGQEAYTFSSNSIYRIDLIDKRINKVFQLNSSAIINSAIPFGSCILIGTDDGIWELDPETGICDMFLEEFKGRVSCLVNEKPDVILIASGNMLFRYSHPKQSLQSIDESRGFPSNEILSACKFGNMLYLGGTQGLVSLSDPQLIFDQRKQELNISGVQLDGKTVSIAGGTVNVPWNCQNISVDFEIVGSDPFQKVLYRYEVDGKNSPIMQESFVPSFSIPAPESGRYHINAYFLNEEGIWTRCSSGLSLRISAPFYSTVWFYLSIAVFIALLAGYLMRRRRKRLYEKAEIERRIKEEEEKNKRLRFLVNVSHELRTPLTLIYSPLGRILKNGDNLPEQLKSQLGNIFSQARQIKDILTLVLDGDKIDNAEEPIHKTANEIDVWAGEIVGEFSDEFASKGMKISLEAEYKGTVYFDRWMCRTVLSNLLMNAIKYCQNGCEVNVNISEMRPGFVRVSVCDNGPGLGDTSAEKLFSRHGRGFLDKPGNGIGLSYSDKLIRLHNGNMGALNNPAGQGSIFYFELPVQQTTDNVTEGKIPDYPISVPYPELDNDEALSVGGDSVLVVDDNTGVLDYLTECLKNIFGNVLTAENGEDGLKLARADKPDLIISDVMMPEMDGYTFCREVKSDIEISHIPIILLTARANEESIISGYKCGADYYLTKPFEDELLLAIIRNALTSRKSVQKQFSKLEQAKETLSPVSTTFSLADESFLTKLNTIIEDNISNEFLDVNYLCKEVAMSRSSLYNKIKAITGLGVNDYINKCRLRKSIQYLKCSDMSITEISESLGYNTPRYFSSSFKNAFGKTPKEWRAESRMDESSASRNIR